MKFKQGGNLGKVDLLDRHISKKFFFDETTITKEELEEISFQLKQFNYLMSNLFMYKGSLESENFGAIISILDELEPLYRNYNPESDKEVKNVF